MLAEQVPYDIIQIVEDRGFIPKISTRIICGGSLEKNKRPSSGYILVSFSVSRIHFIQFIRRIQLLFYCDFIISKGSRAKRKRCRSVPKRLRNVMGDGKNSFVFLLSIFYYFIEIIDVDVSRNANSMELVQFLSYDEY